MTSKRKLLGRSRLMVIVDRECAEERHKSVVEIAREAIRGGADIIQLRDKASPYGERLRDARAVGKATRPAGCLMIVNDSIDIAVAAHADGVHLGRSDPAIALARKIMGPRAIIGGSAQTAREAAAAFACGADYVGIGPIFPTPVKPGEKASGTSIFRRIGLGQRPVFAIGGIDGERAQRLREAGVTRIAVIRAVTGSSHPREATAQLRKILYS